MLQGVPVSVVSTTISAAGLSLPSGPPVMSFAEVSSAPLPPPIAVACVPAIALGSTDGHGFVTTAVPSGPCSTGSLSSLSPQQPIYTSADGLAAGSGLTPPGGEHSSAPMYDPQGDGTFQLHMSNSPLTPIDVAERSNTNTKKNAWTTEEDLMLARIVAENGPGRWTKVAQQLPGRMGKQCRERWFNHLAPEVK